MNSVGSLRGVRTLALRHMTTLIAIDCNSNVGMNMSTTRLWSRVLWYYAKQESKITSYASLSGTNPGVANKTTAMNSVTAERGYQNASLSCFAMSLAVAAKKASRVTRRTEMTKRM